MYEFTSVIEHKSIVKYLLDRNLLKQYQKSKKYLLLWNLEQINFKLRQPKQDKIYYFKINKQFRALCYVEWDVVKVFKIDNHQ